MSIPHFSPDAWRFIFNTPLECGLRCAALLLAAYPAPCDLQRLVQYEYLLVHSGDVPQGPPSLHPDGCQFAFPLGYLKIEIWELENFRPALTGSK